MEQYQRKQIFVALWVYIGHTIAGYGGGWLAPVIIKLQDPKQTPLQELITDQQASWIGSLALIGCFFGPYMSGFLGNLIGRKPCLFLGAVAYLLSSLVMAFAWNLTMIYISRILLGLGAGIVVVVSHVYLGEIASTPIRGLLLTASSIFNNIGTVMVYTVAPYVSYSATCYILVAMSVVFILSLFFIPETPLFLVLKGQEDKAKAALTFLGRDSKIDEVLSSKIEVPGSYRKETKDQWTEIITVKSNRKALKITLILNILTQTSGVTAVSFFVTRIFELADSSVAPHIATIIVGVMQLFSSFIASFLVERSGRKSLLLVSTAVCSLSLGILGTYFYLDSAGSSVAASAKWLPLVTLLIYYLSFYLGFGIIPATITGEMFTPNVRVNGTTVSLTTSWICGFGVVTIFGYMLIIGPYFAFWVFAASCAITFIFTAIFVPETKGKSLMEIQEMLSR